MSNERGMVVSQKSLKVLNTGAPRPPTHAVAQWYPTRVRMPEDGGSSPIVAPWSAKFERYPGGTVFSLGALAIYFQNILAYRFLQCPGPQFQFNWYTANRL